MFKRVLFTTMIVASAITSSFANAAIITGSGSGSVSITGKEPSTAIFDLFHAIVFPQFDSQSGTRTLTSVELTFTAASYGTLTFTNTSSLTNTTPSSSVNTVLALSAQQNGTSDLFQVLGGGLLGVPYSPGVLLPSAMGSVNVPSTDQSDSDSMTITSGSSAAFALNDFVGTGNMTAYLSSVVQIITTTAGTFNVSGEFLSDATIDYVYNFEEETSTPVPAPSMIALLGLAIALVGFRKRQVK